MLDKKELLKKSERKCKFCSHTWIKNLYLTVCTVQMSSSQFKNKLFAKRQHTTHKSHFDQIQCHTTEHFQNMSSFDVSLFESERNIPRYRNVYVLERWIFPFYRIDWEEKRPFSLSVGIFKWLRGKRVNNFFLKNFSADWDTFLKKFWYQVSVVKPFSLTRFISSFLAKLFFKFKNKFNDGNFLKFHAIYVFIFTFFLLLRFIAIMLSDF